MTSVVPVGNPVASVIVVPLNVMVFLSSLSVFGFYQFDCFAHKVCLCVYPASMSFDHLGDFLAGVSSNIASPHPPHHVFPAA